MRTLCSRCAADLLETQDHGATFNILHEVARGNLRICFYPRNCDNVRTPGHSQDGPRTLEELPPSARG